MSEAFITRGSELDSKVKVETKLFTLMIETNTEWQVPDDADYSIRIFGGGGYGGGGWMNNAIIHLNMGEVIPITIGGPGGTTTFGSCLSANGGSVSGSGGSGGGGGYGENTLNCSGGIGYQFGGGGGGYGISNYGAGGGGSAINGTKGKQGICIIQYLQKKIIIK